MAYRKTLARQEHSDKVRRSFLSAAESLCRNEGPEAVTVRRVVTLTDSSTGNFYFHFKDKDDLLRQMTLEEYARAGRRIDTFRQGQEDPLAQLIFTVYAGLRIAYEEDSLLPLVLAGPLREISSREYSRFFIERTGVFFRHHPELLKDQDPGRAALFWQGSIQSLVAGTVPLDPELDSGPMIRECILWNCRALGIAQGNSLPVLERAERTWSDLAVSDDPA